MTMAKDRTTLSQGGTEERPNILWLGVDQMRYDSAGCHGNQICSTPHLDKLASEGIIHQRLYSLSPLFTRTSFDVHWALCVEARRRHKLRFVPRAG
ncbi:MAG TPA: hypothetical protein DCP08_09075 [Chloroflexi bacterium]|nr:hypothetical protein [Chloroflexota bacterium]